MTDRVPEWLEPMAATLTQERFTGPDWLFERKLDGIRLLAFKDGDDVRLLSRNRLPQNAAYPSVAEAIAALPVDDVILDGEATGVWGTPGRRRLQRLRRPLAERPRYDEATAQRTAGASREHPDDIAARARRGAGRRRALGARLPRGLGGRDRQAPRLALRAPPLAALAEDEVRGDPGAGRRRLHRPARLARRPRRPPGWLLRRRRLRLCRQGRHRLRHGAAPRPATPPRRP